jgi:predicted alpha/beta-hydrolase family hydrolase
MLFVQGSRDAFGSPDELRPVITTLHACTDLLVVEDGDHSFVVPKRQGKSRDDVLAQVADGIAGWVRSTCRQVVDEPRRSRRGRG